MPYLLENIILLVQFKSKKSYNSVEVKMYIDQNKTIVTNRNVSCIIAE